MSPGCSTAKTKSEARSLPHHPRATLRRVERTSLLLQQGTADIRSRLEAENDRVEAKNRLTAALVDYALSLLEFERDVGTLAVHAPEEALQNGFPVPEPADK